MLISASCRNGKSIAEDKMATSMRTSRHSAHCFLIQQHARGNIL
jgi:hypothetical protein